MGDYFTENDASELESTGNCKAIAHTHARKSAREREFDLTDLQAQSTEFWCPPLRRSSNRGNVVPNKDPE